MRVVNIHERFIPGAPAEVGALLDSLASDDDRLWPHERWPPMRLRPGLEVGAVGGHGPIRYTVVEYEPGARIVFRFTAPDGFDGVHCYGIEAAPKGSILRHVLTMDAHGRARLSWPLVFRPLHDALIEDSFDKAALAFGEEATARWSVVVRGLRKVLGKRMVR